MKKKTRGNGQLRRGHLVIIGGAEDRERYKVVLRRFIEVAGGEDARIVVLTAASVAHEEMWSVYDGAFGDLGVKKRETVNIASRDDANDEANATRLLDANGIFMTAATRSACCR